MSGGRRWALTCGTIPSMPQDPIESSLKSASLAARHARDVRKFHARRTERGSAQREADLAQARERISRAMTPLRQYIGKATYKNGSHTREDVLERVREASRTLQSERRKLWKMQDRTKRKNTPNGQQTSAKKRTKLRDQHTDASESSGSGQDRQSPDVGAAPNEA